MVESSEAHALITDEGAGVLRARGMVMIGAGGRNCGKTTLACALIRRASGQWPVAGVKVTTVHEGGGRCPRGDDGCGVCSSLVGPYRITDEHGDVAGKDTTRLYECGADPVRWLCVRPSSLAEGAGALVDGLGSCEVAVCESNSLRKVIEPDLFVVARHHDRRSFKRSCREVLPYADLVVSFDGESFDVSPDDFDVRDGRWVVRREATAIVLAGGKSRRMGRDKALLPLGGRTMIEHIVDQLRPHVTEIVVSAADPDRYAFLGLEVIADREPDQGPMMAIASVLERTRNELNVVVPCDVPTLPVDLLYRMLRHAGQGAEIAVPVNDEGLYEPLYAVYRRSVLSRLDGFLAKGRRRIFDVYDVCETKVVPLRSGEELVNVNTLEDYEKVQECS